MRPIHQSGVAHGPKDETLRPSRVGIVVAATVALMATVALVVGALVVFAAGHAAVTGYWGSEWENADADFHGYLLTWLVAAFGIALAWRGCTGATGWCAEEVPSPPDVTEAPGSLVGGRPPRGAGVRVGLCGSTISSPRPGLIGEHPGS